MTHVVSVKDYWNLDSDTEWEIKQLESTIVYYKGLIDSTASLEEKYEFQLLLGRRQRELGKLKDEYDL